VRNKLIVGKDFLIKRWFILVRSRVTGEKRYIGNSGIRTGIKDEEEE